MPNYEKTFTIASLLLSIALGLPTPALLASSCDPSSPEAIKARVECRYSGVPQSPELIKEIHHCENEKLICEVLCRGTLPRDAGHTPLCTDNLLSDYGSGCAPQERLEYRVRVEHTGIWASDCLNTDAIKRSSPQVACLKLGESGVSLCRKKGELTLTHFGNGICCR